jgi:hypothetical protein
MIADDPIYRSSTVSSSDSNRVARMDVLHSTPKPGVASQIQRLRRGIESLSEDLDFARWLFVFSAIAVVLLVTHRFRDAEARR